MDYDFRNSFLKHIFRKTKPKQEFLLVEEEEEEKEEVNKEDQYYWEDWKYITSFTILHASFDPIIEFIEEQISSFHFEIEEKRQFVLSLLRKPISTVEEKIASYQHLHRSELYLRRLYKYEMKMSHWIDFFPPYNWEETLQEEKEKYNTKHNLIQQKEQLFHSFISELNNKNQKGDPWYSSVILKENKYETVSSSSSSSLINRLFIPEIAKIILSFNFPSEYSKDINSYPSETKSITFLEGKKEKENSNNGFYRIQWISHPQKSTYCWSIKTDSWPKETKKLTDEDATSEYNHPFSLFSFSILDPQKKEVGGEIQMNSLSELLLSSLCFSKKEFDKNICLRRELVHLLVLLSFPFVYNINYECLINKLVHIDQEYTTIPFKSNNSEKLLHPKDFKEMIPWIISDNITYPLITENKLVTWDENKEVGKEQAKLSYRLDVGKSEYSQGKFYYWSLSFYEEDLTTYLDTSKEYYSRKERSRHKKRNEIHPLKLVNSHWLERNYSSTSFYTDRNYVTSGSIVVVNELSTLCLKLLGLSNQKLQKEINSMNKKDVFKYRQCMIDYLISVTN